MSSLDAETQRLADIQDIYETSLDELKDAEAAADENKEIVALQRKVEKAYMNLRAPEQNFKDAINTLLVDCLEAVVTNDEKKKGEKFALLEKFGKGSDFTNAEKMERIGAARGGGGERYAHRR
jgi:hypothetical protein